MPLGTSAWLASALKDERVRSLEPTFVCLIDILGYKNYVETATLFQAASEQAGVIKFSNQLAGGNLFAGGRTDDGRVIALPRTSCKVIRFSDTFLIYSFKGVTEALIDIASTACKLMGTLISFGIPVRGALTRGCLYVSDDNTEIVGEGLVRAYALEQEQAWLGAIIDRERIGTSKEEEEFLKLMVRRGELHPYDVPIKVAQPDGTKVIELRPRLCLGWPMQMTRFASGTLRELIYSRTSPGGQGDRDKIEAGLRFFDTYVRDSEHAEAQRDLWRVMSEAVLKI